MMDLLRDERWGYILIAAGIISLSLKPFNRFGDWLGSKSEEFVTALYCVIALAVVVIALTGSKEAKIATLTWMVSP